MSLKSKFFFAVSDIINNLACHSDGTVNRYLLNLSNIFYSTPPSSNPVNGVKTLDYTLDSSRQLWFRLFLPVHAIQTQPFVPVIIYFHGGGFVQFSPSSTPFDTLCRQLAVDTSAVVISVNYRVAPEHKFPAQYDDGFDLIKFIDGDIREKIPDFPENADLQQCFLAGDSAGGNIAHHLVVRCDGFEFKEVKLRGLIMIQPFFGGEERTESELRLKNAEWLSLRMSDKFWKAFLPIGSDRDHPAVNVFGPRSEVDISDIEYPPVVVIVGGLDLLQDRQRMYVDGLKRSGKEVELVEYPNEGHGFYGKSSIGPDYDKLIAQVGKFVQKLLF